MPSNYHTRQVAPPNSIALRKHLLNYARSGKRVLPGNWKPSKHNAPKQKQT